MIGRPPEPGPRTRLPNGRCCPTATNAAAEAARANARTGAGRIFTTRAGFDPRRSPSPAPHTAAADVPRPGRCGRATVPRGPFTRAAGGGSSGRRPGCCGAPAGRNVLRRAGIVASLTPPRKADAPRGPNRPRTAPPGRHPPGAAAGSTDAATAVPGSIGRTPKPNPRRRPRRVPPGTARVVDPASGLRPGPPVTPARGGPAPNVRA